MTENEISIHTEKNEQDMQCASAGGQTKRKSFIWGKVRRERNLWTEQETRDLLDGVIKYGYGNWAKIIEDSQLVFNERTSVDLKDRFRTMFPSKLTEIDNERNEVCINGAIKFPKCTRKSRSAFLKQEDEALLKGFAKYGPAWSTIQKDASLKLNNRRSTDLRDRFRNAFPEKYIAAGFKHKKKKAPSTSQVQDETWTSQIDPEEMVQFSLKDLRMPFISNSFENYNQTLESAGKNHSCLYNRF